MHARTAVSDRGGRQGRDTGSGPVGLAESDRNRERAGEMDENEEGGRHPEGPWKRSLGRGWDQ